MPCPGAYQFGRRTFRCWKRHGGGINLHEAIKQPCDVYFYETVKRVGIDRLAETCRKLGLGQIYDLALAGQKQGIVPDTAWKRKRFGQPWYPGDTISCGIGQGYVSTTPLQLAVATARVATGTAVVRVLGVRVKIDAQHVDVRERELGHRTRSHRADRVHEKHADEEGDRRPHLDPSQHFGRHREDDVPVMDAGSRLAGAIARLLEERDVQLHQAPVDEQRQGADTMRDRSTALHVENDFALERGRNFGEAVRSGGVIVARHDGGAAEA